MNDASVSNVEKGFRPSAPGVKIITGDWIVGLVVGLGLAMSSLLNATIYVDPAGSDASGNCRNPATPCASVKHAVETASWDETVMIAAGTYTESGIEINKNLKLIGAGANATVIQGSALPCAAPTRIIRVSVSVCVEISNLQIARGFSQMMGDENGGGFLNAGDLEMRNVIVRECDAGTSGHGGGGYNLPGSRLHCYNSWFDQCNAGDGADSADGFGGSGGCGGGLMNMGDCTMIRTAVTECTAGNGGSGKSGGGSGGHGGGIENQGTAVFHCGTISGCCAGDGGDSSDGGGGGGGSGGGFNSTGFPFELGFSTGASCKAGAGGAGVFDGFDGCGGCGHNNSGHTGVTSHNSIMADNTVPPGGCGPDFGGTLNSGGFNVIENLGIFSPSGNATDIEGMDPNLLPLAMSGGLSPVHGLGVGSVAINAGNPVLAVPTIDQRGASRTSSTNDIGAFESGGAFLADLDSDMIPDFADTDKDGDDMLDAWEDSNGLDSSDPNDGVTDKDGDGISNHDEHDFCTDPCLSSSRPQLSIQRDGPGFKIILTPVVAGKKYSLRISTGLRKWDGVSGMTNQVTNDPVANPLIFADGFESGDTSAWTASVP